MSLLLDLLHIVGPGARYWGCFLSLRVDSQSPGKDSALKPLFGNFSGFFPGVEQGARIGESYWKFHFQAYSEEFSPITVEELFLLYKMVPLSDFFGHLRLCQTFTMSRSHDILRTSSFTMSGEWVWE